MHNLLVPVPLDQPVWRVQQHAGLGIAPVAGGEALGEVVQRLVHDAMADVRATIDVFKGQIEKYDGVDYEDDDGNVTENPVRNDMQVIHDFTNDNRFLDATQRMKYGPDGIPVFNFGKYNGKPVAETLANDQQYYNWILNKEFSSQVKQLVKKLVKEYEKKAQG